MEEKGNQLSLMAYARWISIYRHYERNLNANRVCYELMTTTFKKSSNNFVLARRMVNLLGTSVKVFLEEFEIDL